MIKKWILLSFCFSLMSCGYKGDGDFKSYGYWPLITYELTLPDFPFETGSKHKFDLKGYKSHETSTISIELFSNNEHDFAELDTEVELKIVNDLGVTFFYRKSPLNAHFKRMQELKEASWANEYEWNGRYSYKNQDVSDRAVPFSSIEMPAKTKSMRYFNFFPSDAGSLSLTINIGSVPSQFEDLKVRINLSSGWK